MNAKCQMFMARCSMYIECSTFGIQTQFHDMMKMAFFRFSFHRNESCKLVASLFRSLQIHIYLVIVFVSHDILHSHTCYQLNFTLNNFPALDAHTQALRFRSPYCLHLCHIACSSHSFRRCFIASLHRLSVRVFSLSLRLTSVWRARQP